MNTTTIGLLGIAFPGRPGDLHDTVDDLAARIRSNPVIDDSNLIQPAAAFTAALTDLTSCADPDAAFAIATSVGRVD